MFTSISWAEFSIPSIVILVIYFIVIGILYYKDEIRQLLTRKEPAMVHVSEPVAKTMATDMPDPIPIVHELVTELGLQIRGALENNVPSPELYLSLQKIVARYPYLANTDFKEKINLYIVEELKLYTGFKFSEAEMLALWKT